MSAARPGSSSARRRSRPGLGFEARAGGHHLLAPGPDQAVRENCRRAIWLDKGRIEASGPADEVVDRYLAFSASG